MGFKVQCPFRIGGVYFPQILLASRKDQRGIKLGTLEKVRSSMSPATLHKSFKWRWDGGSSLRLVITLCIGVNKLTQTYETSKRDISERVSYILMITTSNNHFLFTLTLLDFALQTYDNIAKTLTPMLKMPNIMLILSWHTGPNTVG